MNNVITNALIFLFRRICVGYKVLKNEHIFGSLRYCVGCPQNEFCVCDGKPVETGSMT